MRLDPTVYVPIPSGDYPARIDDLEPKNEGEFGPGIKLIYYLGPVEDIEGVVKERTLVGWCSQTVSPRSKLGAIMAAVGLDPTQSLDTDDLRGKMIMLTVIKDRWDDGTPANKIVGYAPYTPKRRASQAPLPGVAKAGAKPARRSQTSDDNMDEPDGFDLEQDDRDPFGLPGGASTDAADQVPF